MHEFFEIWNVPLDLRSFVETDNTGAPFITARPLIHLARNPVYANAIAYTPNNWASLRPSESWKEVMSHRSLFEIAALTQAFGIPPEVQNENRQKMSEFLQKIDSLSLWQLSPGKHATVLELQILWSIEILLESLHHLSILCVGRQRGVSWVSKLDFVTQGLRRQGWCPSRFVQITHLLPCLQYYLSLLPSFDHREHTTCTGIRCLNIPLAMTKSGPGHDEKTCNGYCVMVGGRV